MSNCVRPRIRLLRRWSSAGHSCWKGPLPKAEIWPLRIWFSDQNFEAQLFPKNGCFSKVWNISDSWARFSCLVRSEEMRKAISKTEFVKFEVDGQAAQAGSSVLHWTSADWHVRKTLGPFNLKNASPQRQLVTRVTTLGLQGHEDSPHGRDPKCLDRQESEAPTGPLPAPTVAEPPPKEPEKEEASCPSTHGWGTHLSWV